MNSLLSKQDAQQSIELDSVLSNIFISNLYTYISLEDKKKNMSFQFSFPPALECHYQDIPALTFQLEENWRDISEPKPKQKHKRLLLKTHTNFSGKQVVGLTCKSCFFLKVVRNATSSSWERFEGSFGDPIFFLSLASKNSFHPPFSPHRPLLCTSFTNSSST